MGMLLASFGAAILGYIVLGSLWNYSKLRQFKGPPIAGFTEFWLFWQSWKANLNVAESEAIQEYGTHSSFVPRNHSRHRAMELTGMNNGRSRLPDRAEPSYHWRCGYY